MNTYKKVERRIGSSERKEYVMAYSSIREELEKVNSKHTSVPVRELHILVAETEAMRSFNEAFVREGMRKNPLMAEKINLTVDELSDYENFLIHKRVEIVQGTCREFRVLKRLAMPCFIERVLTDIGRVKILERGLDIRPVADDSQIITLAEAIEISNKIESFYDDLAVVVGAMPGAEEGNPETMTMALIEGYILGQGDYDDPLVQYIVYFLAMTLQETQFNCLYYMRYDDVRTIASNISALGRSLVL